MLDATQIKQTALELGFDAVGVTSAAPLDEAHEARFRQWLSERCGASMGYLNRWVEMRFDPRELLDGAQSVVCVAVAYKPAELPERPSGGGPWGRVAVYGLYDDYHEFIRERLRQLGQAMGDRAAHWFRVCVDTAPLAERALAQRAGLGYIGKSRLLIHPRLGPQVFLGELITTARLEPDAPAEGTCGDCRLCIEACPTGALGPDGMLDARRCLSYLTGEHEGPIEADLAGRLGETLYRCERCMEVCPHAKSAPASRNRDFGFHPQRRWLSLPAVARWRQDDFDAVFVGSAVTWTGVERLRRNARLCLAEEASNSGDRTRPATEPETGR